MDTSTPEDEIAQLRKQLFERLGRNLANFQLVERQLRFLLSRSDFRIEKSPNSPPKTSSPLRKGMTMGALATGIVRPLVSPPPTASDVNSLRVTHELGPEYRLQLSRDLRKLVKERNWLVHHALDAWQDSPESTRVRISELDAQFDRVRSVLDDVHGLAKSLNDAIQVAFADPAKLFED